MQPLRQVSPSDITVVVPSYGRHEVLAEAVERDLALRPAPAEVIVVDQNPTHPENVGSRLERWHRDGLIRWIRLSRPSQPAAMNVGLLAASTDYVLFQDDDVVPPRGLIGAFAESLNDLARRAPDCWCIVGGVLQPGATEMETGSWTPPPEGFPAIPLNGNRPCFVEDAAAGNLCTDRRRAIALGGFDEQFVGSAHNCDTDFARRVIRSGGRLLFEPRATVRHLRAPTGGVRTYGDFLRTWRPHVRVTPYYAAMNFEFPVALQKVAVLLVRSVTTRHHLRRPWDIPATAFSSLVGLAWAVKLRLEGPKPIAQCTSGVEPTVAQDPVRTGGVVRW